MRRASILSLLLLVSVVVAPTAALADVPVAVDDPPAAFADPAPATPPAAPAPATAKPHGSVAAKGEVSIAGIADATAVHAAPRTVASRRRIVKPAGTAIRQSAQLPFTGVDSGLILVVSLFGSLLLIGGILLYLGSESGRDSARSVS